MAVRVAYLGPQGTYSEQAAIDYDPQSDRVAYHSIPLVVGAADKGEVEEAIVPIENSLEGTVTFTVDLLIHESDLKIRSEVVVPIHHYLLTEPETRMDQIEVVYSQPQALAQCRSYLTRTLPNAVHVASLSTASAVTDMRESRHTAAAISSRRAAQIFDATIIDANIEDVSNNQTRFVVLSESDHEPTGNDRTSICFDFSQDAPGVLFDTLGELAGRNINMIKIESRPDKRSLGQYVFLIDLEGHREDEVIRDALEGIRSHVSMFKILGSYPIAAVPA